MLRWFDGVAVQLQASARVIHEAAEEAGERVQLRD